MNSVVFKAIAIILLGITAFDFMGVAVRTLGSNYSILQISVLRNLFGIIPALLLLALGPGVSALKQLNSSNSSKKTNNILVRQKKIPKADHYQQKFNTVLSRSMVL